jgi:Arc/MetJ-type ribon-helix-helix transcriptional regulator
MARKKQPTNLSITPAVLDMMAKLINHLGYANKSELVAQLVREECERRGVGFQSLLPRYNSAPDAHGETDGESAAETPSPKPRPVKPTTYKKK